MNRSRRGALCRLGPFLHSNGVADVIGAFTAPTSIFMLTTILLSLVPLPLQPAVPEPQGEEVAVEAGVEELAAALDLDRLKSEIDHSLRWLRSEQNLETGAYGDALLPTLRALETLAESPRRYRASDGPFVAKALEFALAQRRDDGAFAAPEATRDAALETTAMAVRTFERFGIDVELDLAREFLGSYTGRVDADPADPNGVWERVVANAPNGRQALWNHAANLLVQRREEGYWERGRDRLFTTCDALSSLSSLYGYLKKTDPAKAEKHATPLPAFAPADRERAVQALNRGMAFLLDSAEDGLWGFDGRADPGITAMVLGALYSTPLVQHGDLGAEVRETLERGLDYLVSLQKEDGSIHAGQLANYVTSASIMALAKSGRTQDREVIERARRYLQGLQADEGEGYERSDRFYGGVGYGGDERPDLSNMQMALEALAEAGTPAEDESFQKALVFLQRCQNRSESNDLELVEDGQTIISGNDGGAGYGPGTSKAGYVELADGRRVPRSYGSMSYALLKGYLFAGLEKDDPRVEALWDWLQRNYTLDVNPGFEASSDPTAAYQGLFYYYFTMAKALDLYGSESVVDGSGASHAWRSELAGRLVSMQRQDGSWINSNAPRWYEGNPVLATTYAMSTLALTLPDENAPATDPGEAGEQ